MLEDIKNSLDAIVGFTRGVDQAFNNPGKNLLGFLGEFCKDLLQAFDMVSFEILLVVGFFGLLFYIMSGWEKGKLLAWASPCLYLLIRALTQIIC